MTVGRATVRGWLLCLALLSGVPACRCASSPPSGPRFVAIAFRDHVPGYQKLASEKYAVHYLEKTYDDVIYLEATATDDGRTRLLDAISTASLAYDGIDLFFLSNGDRYDLWASALSGPEKLKLRLVYDTGAGDARQGPAWLSMGVRTFVGHPAGNVAPLFLRYFLPAWVDGTNVRTAVDDANTETKADLLGGVAKGVAGVVEAVGGPKLDRPRLWAGTEAVVFGDDTLVIRPPSPP